jgi:hypothetical protein
MFPHASQSPSPAELDPTAAMYVPACRSAAPLVPVPRDASYVPDSTSAPSTPIIHPPKPIQRFPPELQFVPIASEPPQPNSAVTSLNPFAEVMTTPKANIEACLVSQESASPCIPEPEATRSQVRFCYFCKIPEHYLEECGEAKKYILIPNGKRKAFRRMVLLSVEEASKGIKGKALRQEEYHRQHLGQQAAPAYLEDLATSQIHAPAPQLTNDHPNQETRLQVLQPMVEVRTDAAPSDIVIGRHSAKQEAQAICSVEISSPRLQRHPERDVATSSRSCQAPVLSFRGPEVPQTICVTPGLTAPAPIIHSIPPSTPVPASVQEDFQECPEPAYEFPADSECAELPSTDVTSSGLCGASESVHTPLSISESDSAPLFVDSSRADTPSVCHSTSIPIPLSTPGVAPSSPLSVRDPVCEDTTGARADLASAHPKAGTGPPVSTCDSGHADSAITRSEWPSVVGTVSSPFGASESLPAPYTSSIRMAGAPHSSCDVTSTPSASESNSTPLVIDSISPDSPGVCNIESDTLKISASVITTHSTRVSSHSSPERPQSEEQAPHPSISQPRERRNDFLSRLVPTPARFQAQWQPMASFPSLFQRVALFVTKQEEPQDHEEIYQQLPTRSHATAHEAFVHPCDTPRDIAIQFPSSHDIPRGPGSCRAPSESVPYSPSPPSNLPDSTIAPQLQSHSEQNAATKFSGYQPSLSTVEARRPTAPSGFTPNIPRSADIIFTSLVPPIVSVSLARSSASASYTVPFLGYICVSTQVPGDQSVLG